MKLVILAGGLGTRIAEESHLKPKPMIEIGEKPILWHIMKEYSAQGFNEFVICGGYKQHIIKQWFSDYFICNSDVTFDFTDNNKMIIHNNETEKWKVTVVDTGLNTGTGGRLKRVKEYIGNETFMMTYGDGVSNVNLQELLKHHQESGALVTLTSVTINQRYGILGMDEQSRVTSFREKSDNDAERVNAGYMVLEPEVFEYIEGDATYFEQEPLEKLVNEGKLYAYRHEGFWLPMDTMRDKNKLEELWQSGQAPWKIWDK